MRLILRLPALLAFSLGAYLWLRIVDGILVIPAGRPRAPTQRARWRTRMFRRWARGVARLIGMRIRIRGRAPIPPFLLVANHLGYIDVILIATQVPCIFVARADVEHWPVVGRLCQAVDTIFIDRGAKRDIPRVMHSIQQRLDETRGIVLFPEGTSTKGREVGPFKPSLLEFAARVGLPVSYSSLTYRTPAGQPGADQAICWWGDMGFGGHFLKMLMLPGFDATLVFGNGQIVEKDRKMLASRLQEAVQHQFEPVVET